jgi:hypothetical protein
MTGIGTEPCPGFHWPWKGLPLVDILDKGTDPYHGFQGPCEEGTPVFSPCVGIVPYTGFCCKKPGFPPIETATDENALLPNVSNKENEKEPIDVVLEAGP